MKYLCSNTDYVLYCLYKEKAFSLFSHFIHPLGHTHTHTHKDIHRHEHTQMPLRQQAKLIKTLAL